jgi:hypothetical protein
MNGAGDNKKNQKKAKSKPAPGCPLKGFTGEELCSLESFRFNGLSRGELPIHVWF